VSTTIVVKLFINPGLRLSAKNYYKLLVCPVLKLNSLGQSSWTNGLIGDKDIL
jgi:hypothetical protein